MNAPTAPEGFRHHLVIQVRWGDMDALGHVNNSVFLTYLEQARIAYMEAERLWSGSGGREGVIMARVVLDYKLPVFAEDDVHVFSRCSRMGGRSFDVEQQIIRVHQGQPGLAALGTITVVAYDYESGRSISIPAAWRAAIKNYEVVAPAESPPDVSGPQPSI